MRTKVAVCLALGAALSWYGIVGARQQPAGTDYGVRQMSAVRYLKVAHPREDDKLGVGDPLVGVTMAMSADGNTLAVSTPHEDSAATGVNGNQEDESAWDAGAAYVFVRNGNAWSQQTYIKASNTEQSDKFGFAVAMSGDGNTLAVSATMEDSSARGINGNQADNSAENSGAVYVFARRGDTWTQQAYVKASNTDAGDQFGWSVALSFDGNTMAVGATSEASAASGINGNQADNSAADAGAVYVFARRGTTWSQQAYVKSANMGGGDRLGFCVDLSDDGDTMAVCAYDEDGGATGVNGVPDDSTGGSGAAYVFVRRGATWSQEAYVKASNTIRNSAFGSAIVLSGDGNTLAIGAADEDSLSPGIDGDQSSLPVDEGSAGVVYVYTRTNGVWVQQAYIKSFNIGPVDLFGVRLAISRDGNVLAAGAPLQGGAGQGINPPNHHEFTAPMSGAAYVFLRNQGRWSQNAYLKAPNSEEYDEFGSAVALSADGTMLAVAANGEDGGSSGVDGDQSDNSIRDSGAIFIF